MTRHITLLAPQGCSGAALLGVVEMLQVANRIEGNLGNADAPLFAWRMLGTGGATVRTNTGISVSVDAVLPPTGERELLFVVPPSIASADDLDQTLADCAADVEWLRNHAADYAVLCTTCSGPFLLAAAGLLAGNTVTTSWWLRHEFARRYPLVELAADDVCVISEGLICGGSTTSYQDVCLRLIEDSGGRHLARLVAKYMMVDNQRRSQSPYTILTLVDNDDPLVERAIRWIRRNMHRDFRIEEVAQHVAVSERTLIRHFQKSIGESPQGFTQRVRIEKSKILLETTQLRLGDIVERCGYSDESAFRRLFKKYCQVSPREYRRRFNVKQERVA